MDASDDQSCGECAFDVSDDDFRCYGIETKVQLKKEPGPWIARNPARLLEVINLKLELPDHVYNISDSIEDLLNLERLIIKTGINLNCLPRTLSTLPNLVWLQLENCPNLSQFPSNFGNLIVTLRYLTIRSCAIKSLPHSLSQLRLTVMELNNCVFIQELPASLHIETLKLEGCHVKSFSTKPRNLDQLEISNCLYVNDILTSLNNFDCPCTLQIKSCDMESLPNSIAGISIVTLLIEGCINMKSLPQNLTQYAYLYSLTLLNCGLESIPSGLRILGSLSIENCPIKSLDGCGTGLTKLECLTIVDCVALKDLPTDINTLVTLRELHIEGCTSIKFLPNISALHKLHSLSLKGCLIITELPADFEKLKKLRNLVLTDTNVQSLPSTIAKLPNLRNIYLPRCFRFETLPNDFDLKKIKLLLPLSFRGDSLPANYSLKRRNYIYQLHFKDERNTPPNPRHLPQPIPEEQVLAGAPGNLDEGRFSCQSAFVNHDVERDLESRYSESRCSESRYSESVDSTSQSVTSKGSSNEATSLVRTGKRTMGRAIDDGHRKKQSKSQDGMFQMYNVWATYKANEINFELKEEFSFTELKQELAERLTLECELLSDDSLSAHQDEIVVVPQQLQSHFSDVQPVHCPRSNDEVIVVGMKKSSLCQLVERGHISKPTSTNYVEAQMPTAFHSSTMELQYHSPELSEKKFWEDAFSQQQQPLSMDYAQVAPQLQIGEAPASVLFGSLPVNLLDHSVPPLVNSHQS